MFVRGNIRESKPNLEYKAICPWESNCRLRSD